MRRASKLSLSERLRAAALCGIAIPLVYLMILNVIPGLALLPPLMVRALFLPIEWPSLIYFHFNPPDPEQFFAFLSGGQILSIAVGNFVLYSLLTFAFLYWRGRTKDVP